MTPDEYSAVKSRIAALDLEPIKFRLIKDGDYSEEQVNILDKWYRRLLFLNFKYKDRPIVVSEAIDAFWHQHILDTRKYAEDCETVFGEFLHHFPYFGLRGEEDQRALRTAYDATLDLMKQEFGEVPEEELQVFGDDGLGIEVSSLCSDCGGPNVPNQLERPRLSEVTS
jgi:hypothetical protein